MDERVSVVSELRGGNDGTLSRCQVAAGKARCGLGLGEDKHLGS